MFLLTLLGSLASVGFVLCAPAESEPPPFFDSPGEQHRMVLRDPCFDLYCGHGQMCRRSEDGLSAECVCRPNCPSNRRHKVCGSDGVLYANHCELHRTACREKRNIMVEELEHCIFPGFDDESDVTKRSDEISRLVINKRKYPKDTTEDPWGEESTRTEPTTTTKAPSSCQTVEYEMMKDNLMLYHHEKTIGKRRPSEADYLLSIVFLHYDRNNDGLLERSELLLDTMEEKDEVRHLSDGCTLEDLLRFDDTNGDGVLNGEEFNEAFAKLYSVSVISLDKSLEINQIQAKVGDSIEIKCDVTGTPKPTKIVWNRAGVDLTNLKNEGSSIQVFHDGSLYISDLQLYHGGRYSCHAERNKDVVQTHVLNVTGKPRVQVTPPIQALAPKDDAEMECWVSSQALSKISWLKNDEPLPLTRADKYEIIGDGRVLTVRSVTYADTGAYMCEAVQLDGSMHRGISSLVIQDEPQPTVKPAPNLLLVFSGEGIGLYDPESCRILRQIQSSDVIPGTTQYVCGVDSNQLCRWGEVVNVNNSYVYATQPESSRILALNLAQMVVTEAIETDAFPARLHYVKSWDQLWVVDWRSSADVGNKTIQVLRKASQRGPHELVHPQPIQSHFDVAYRLFLPAEEELGVKWRFGYVGHANQRGMYKLNLEDLRLVRNVDLAPYNCVPNDVVFVARYGFVVVECKEPVTGKPSGQIILDHLSDTVVQYKPDVFGKPTVSPDSMFVVTSNHEADGSFMLAIQKVLGDGLHFQFDAKTSLDVSDIGFVPSFEMHSFDLYASSGLKPDLLYLNLESGHVEVLTSVGEPPEAPAHSWGLPLRPLTVCPDRFHPYIAVTGRQSVSVADGRDKAVNCEISGLIEPQRVAWVRLPVS